MEISVHSLRWVERLAEQESGVQAGERSQVDLYQVREDVLQLESSQFLKELRTTLETLSTLFNQQMAADETKIQLQSLSESRDGFYLSRLNIRIQIESARPGVIQVQTKRIAVENPIHLSTATLEANFGAFDEVTWLFLGEKINSEQVARHFLTELVQNTMRTSRPSAPAQN